MQGWKKGSVAGGQRKSMRHEEQEAGESQSDEDGGGENGFEAEGLSHCGVAHWA